MKEMILMVNKILLFIGKYMKIPFRLPSSSWASASGDKSVNKYECSNKTHKYFSFLKNN